MESDEERRLRVNNNHRRWYWNHVDEVRQRNRDAAKLIRDNNKHECIDCGSPCHYKSIRCKSCETLSRFGTRTKDKSGRWKGGTWVTNKGYRVVYVDKDSKYYPMTPANKNYVLEHRLVVAKHIGRCLESCEVVHHKNGIKDDNRIDNLELLPNANYHVVDTHAKARIRKLEKDVESLTWIILQLIISMQSLRLRTQTNYRTHRSTIPTRLQGMK